MDIDSNPVRPRYLRRTTCVKCSQIGHSVLNGKDVYCKTCFDEYCSHKFRSSFGKHKILQKKNERILIAVSGGPISAGALWDLVRRSCDTNARKRLQIQPEILRILESSGVDQISNWPQSIGSDVMVHVTHMASIFDSDQEFRMESGKASDVLEKMHRDIPGIPNSESLAKLFQSFTNDTSRLDCYRRLKTLLFIRCARKLGIRFLAIGETCTSLSSRILSNTTQGRGGQIRDDVSILDLRWDYDVGNGVRIVRPLREFQNREIAYYNFYHGLFDRLEFECEKPNYVPRMNATSLQSASEDCVDDLQAKFPATVSTLFASASKLLSPAAVKRSDIAVEADQLKCKLCSSMITDEECDTMVAPILCYGCNLTLSDLSDFNLFPVWILSD